MRINKLLIPLAAALVVGGCSDLEVTNPSQRTTDTFWRNEADAMTGLNAVYNGLQANGVFGRWIWLTLDARSDIGTSRSPWTDLQNWTKTVLVTSDFGPNAEMYNHHYQGIFRANQVIANVPEIEMDAALRARIVAEAKFLRAVYYNNLAILFGNVPIVLEPSEAGQFPETRQRAEVFAQAITDATEAAAVLPESYDGGDMGRATKGAANALIGRAQIQQQKWAEAAAAFGEVVSSGEYALAPTYAENFRVEGDNNSEAVFEVQFGGPSVLAQGTRGQNISKLVGPPGAGFTDVQPTEWYFQRFFAERGAGNPDPRLDATIFYNKPGGMDVYTIPFAERYPTGFKDTPIDKTYFWKKHGEYYIGRVDQDWDSAINLKVIRYADVLLYYAEALNEAGQGAMALTHLNAVRSRVGLPGVPGGLSQDAMRRAIEHEMLMELGWENHRFQYLARHDMLKKDLLLPHDNDFIFWVEGKSELLPIPQTEVDLNPNVQQNPGWN
jgi:hypothetical protein